MPKMKTKSAAKKRFQVTGGGHLTHPDQEEPEEKTQPRPHCNR